MELIAQIEEFLKSYSVIVPLEWFVFAGSFLEEIVAPIPSPLIMTTAGSIVGLQGRPFLSLVLLAILGGFGKLIGAVILYFVGDKAEDFILKRFGKFFRVSHEEVENIGKKFQKGWKNGVVLVVIRALPIVPSAPVSIICGIIKISLRTFLISTLAGYIFRNFLFLYLGYGGLTAFDTLSGGIENIESVVQILLVVLVAAVLVSVYFFRKKVPKSNF